MKIYIDPTCDIHYASFYIYGLKKRYGNKVVFRNKPFKLFQHNNHFFAFVVKSKYAIKKVIIDFGDTDEISKDALDWCDIYGKINLSINTVNPKIIPIGPSFGIKIYSYPVTIWVAIINYLKGYKRIMNVRRFFADYKSQLNRPRIRDIQNKTAVDKHFIFFAGSLWKKEYYTNQYRANFMLACKSIPALHFEGGFAPRAKKDINVFEDLTMEKRIGYKLYFDKIKKSVIVFNTPAVLSCHGWKLGEFLCMGKAILSTPLSRLMPTEFEQDKNFITTDGSMEDIRSKIITLVENEDLRSKLEQESKKYFDLWLSPTSVINRILAGK